jgi:hypothetical protein
MNNWLVVWNMTFIFPYIGNNNPTVFHIFQRGGSTTNQTMSTWVHFLRAAVDQAVKCYRELYQAEQEGAIGHEWPKSGRLGVFLNFLGQKTRAPGEPQQL